jgi:hypothetical protein
MICQCCGKRAAAEGSSICLSCNLNQLRPPPEADGQRGEAIVNELLTVASCSWCSCGAKEQPVNVWGGGHYYLCAEGHRRYLQEGDEE